MFSKPNFTQTPNEFFDDIAKTLKEGELRVMLVIMRQTFGWGNKQWDRISISQLIEKTGMKRDAVVRSTKSLVEKKLVTKHKEGTAGQEECWYSLVVENPAEFSNPIDDSNNSDQSSKKTPPSLFRRPTKETTTKEKERREEAQAPPPALFEIRNGVHLEYQKYLKLVEEFGSDKIDEMIARLNEYSDINPRRFKQYACHAAVIRKWMREDSQKTPLKMSRPEKNVEQAQKVIEAYPEHVAKNEIQIQEMGILFCYGQVYQLILFTDFNFMIKLSGRLKKMNLVLPS